MLDISEPRRTTVGKRALSEERAIECQTWISMCQPHSWTRALNSAYKQIDELRIFSVQQLCAFRNNGTDVQALENRRKIYWHVRVAICDKQISARDIPIWHCQGHYDSSWSWRPGERAAKSIRDKLCIFHLKINLKFTTKSTS